jgi:hypothetical protein
MSPGVLLPDGASILDSSPHPACSTICKKNIYAWIYESVTHADRQEVHPAHLFELTSDRHFGKGQLADSFDRGYHCQQMQFAGASDGT